MDRCERAYAFGVPAGETFGDGGDLGGEPHGQNYEWLFPIGSNDQQVSAVQPFVQRKPLSLDLRDMTPPARSRA